MLATQRHANPLRWAVLALAVGILALAGVALACDPSSPAGQDVPSEQPTATPYPPGYVKPTDEPTWTPIPTIPPPTETIEAAQPRTAGAAGAQSASQELLDELVRFAQMEPYLDLRHSPRARWPGPQGCCFEVLGFYIGARRWKFLTTYRGSLARQHRHRRLIMSTSPGVPLEVDSEYIVFVTKGWYLTGDAADTEGRGQTQERLDVLGGEAYF